MFTSRGIFMFLLSLHNFANCVQTYRYWRKLRVVSLMSNSDFFNETKGWGWRMKDKE
jgi:hypothetical protein